MLETLLTKEEIEILVLYFLCFLVLLAVEVAEKIRKKRMLDKWVNPGILESPDWPAPNRETSNPFLTTKELGTNAHQNRQQRN